MLGETDKLCESGSDVFRLDLSLHDKPDVKDITRNFRRALTISR
ncbi:MAG: hypothetical protein SCH66_13510 [Methanolobus sp.]|nr:hypothetical protein [Methanolobus sp.]